MWIFLGKVLLDFFRIHLTLNATLKMEKLFTANKTPLTLARSKKT